MHSQARASPMIALLAAQKCCRGHGYFVNDGTELLHQLSRRPHLRYFVERPDGRVNRVANAAPSCFFLAGDGRCEIHRDVGFDSKPETCRLFPFNFFRRAGAYLIVAPHVSLCPLQVVSAAHAGNASAHDTLFAAMEAKGIAGRVAECTSAIEDIDHLVAVERQIVAMAAAYDQRVGIMPLVDGQLALSKSRDQGIAELAPAPSVRSDMPPAAGHQLAAMADVLGVPISDLVAPNHALTERLAVMTPFLRSQLVFLDAKQSRAEDGTPLSIDFVRVPCAVLATYVMSQLAHLAGMESVEFQTISKLFDEYRSLIVLLAHLDANVEWRPDVEIGLTVNMGEPFQTLFVRLARELLPVRQRRSPRPLGRILADICVLDGPARAQFLKLAAGRLVGRVVPVGTAARGRMSLTRLRTRLQRWSLDNVDDARLVVTSKRVRGRAQS